MFNPLAQGILTGRSSGGAVPEGSGASEEGAGAWLRPGMRPEVLEAADRLRPSADGWGISEAQLALAWCLHQEGVTSGISGASSSTQVETNLAAAEIELTPQTMERIERTFRDVSLEGGL